MILEGRFKPNEVIKVSADKNGLTIGGESLSQAAA
jgi:hypothetical protein